MPISSAEISQLQSSYAGQYVQQMQYAGLIGQTAPSLYGGLNPRANAEGLAGSALKRGMAVGAPSPLRAWR